MDEETQETIKSQPSFFEYITSFSSYEKSQLFNLFQYGGLIIIPIMIVLKIMKMYVPLEDAFKSTTDILIEVILQLVAIILSFFFINKLVLYVPTYSNVEYDKISLLSTILPLFFLIMTLDTKLGEKMNILFDRLLEVLGIKKEGYENCDKKDVSSRPKSTQNTIQQVGANTMLPNAPQPTMDINMQNDLIDNRILRGQTPQRDNPVQTIGISNTNGENDYSMIMDNEPEPANAFGSIF